jgi:hypothetical protein
MKSKLLGFVAVLFIFGSFITPAGVKALTISPPYFDYSLDPGDTAADVIKLYNETSLPMTVYPIAVNFKAGDDEAGIPNFYSGTVDNDKTGLAQWISYSKDPITLEPGSRANLSFSILIPEDGEPGGHYGGIILSSDPPEEKAGAVGVGAQLAAIMLLRVSGDVVEQGSVEEFGFVGGKTVYTHLPVNFFVRFKNEGTTHLRPVGNAFVKNMFGGQAASIEVNPPMSSVLPNSIRKYSFDWKKSGFNENDSELKKEWKNFGFGRYKATVVLNYGKDNQTATAERTFWVLPWMLMIIGFVILVILGLLLKLYNRSIVRSYEKKRSKQDVA